jgi:HEAT repeat protein
MMSEMSETASEAVAVAVAEPRADARAARLAAWIAAGRAAELYSAVSDALSDPRAEVRRRTALLCSEVLPGDHSVRDPLLGALADPVWSVREAVVVALGHFPDPDRTILGSLVELTLRDSSPLVRRAAAVTAGPRFEPPRDYATAIRHPFERQRVRAASALGFTAHERTTDAVELLAGAATDPHPKVRAAALRALAHLEPSAALALLPTVVRRCAEAEPGVTEAARALWERLLADPIAEAFRPLLAFAGTNDVIGAREAVAALPDAHPLRRAWESLPLPNESLDVHRFARHLARVCERVLTGS